MTFKEKSELQSAQECVKKAINILYKLPIDDTVTQIYGNLRYCYAILDELIYGYIEPKGDLKHD